MSAADDAGAEAQGAGDRTRRRWQQSGPSSEQGDAWRCACWSGSPSPKAVVLDDCGVRNGAQARCPTDSSYSSIRLTPPDNPPTPWSGPLIYGRSMAAIEAQGLVKIYGGGKKSKEVRALDGVDLAVPEGTILGLLGPNGAGKTTTVRMLTTLLGRTPAAPGCRARRAARTREVRRAHRPVRPVRGGRREPDRPREPGAWSAGSTTWARPPRRAGRPNCWSEFELTEAADRPAKTYSGGMRRRLDLAARAGGPAAGGLPGRADHRAGPARPAWTRGR